MGRVGVLVEREAVYLNAADLANALYAAGHVEVAKVIVQAAENARRATETFDKPR